MFFVNKKQPNTAVHNSPKNSPQRISKSLVIATAMLSMTLLTACGGSDEPTNGNPTNSGPTPSVTASPDTVSTDQDSPVNIAVLANDSGISSSALLSIEVAPVNGSATVMANNTINYVPATSFTGKESFSYKIAANEKTAIATVTVNVQCPSCTKEITINLSWLPTKNDDDIGYLIYYGNDANNIDSLAFDLSLQTGLDPNAPKVALSAQNDLKLAQGDSVCFQISAYTPNAQSDFSDPICGTI